MTLKMRRISQFLILYVVAEFTWGIPTISSPMWVQVTVPQYRGPGEKAVLHCDFDLRNNTLYAVKWYKEHEEFFRYVPKERPRANWYKVDGVNVDMSKSNSRTVVLYSMNWKTSGLYRCEVSAEAPSFISAQGEARMEIISLPQDDPVITGEEFDYRIGDDINLNCTSGKSHPASILHWYVNEQQIQKPQALIHYPPQHSPKGLVSTTLGLSFKLGHQHFKGGSMKVKCVASIAPVLYQSDMERVVQKHDSSMREMREALLLVRSSSGETRIWKHLGIFSIYISVIMM